MSYNFAYTSNPTLTDSSLGYTIQQISPIPTPVEISATSARVTTFQKIIPIGVYLINVSGSITSPSQNGWTCFVYKGVTGGTIITNNSSIAVNDTRGTSTSFRGTMNIVFIWTNNTASQAINVQIVQTDIGNTSTFYGNISITRIA